MAKRVAASVSETPDQRNAALAAIRKAIRKDHGADSVASLEEGGGARSVIKEVIPSGIAVLDKYILGVGGLPAGRISEVFSEEGTGKSSLALMFLAGAQKAGGVGILADDEMSLDGGRAKTFGVNVADLLIVQPDDDPDSYSMEASLNRQISALEAIPDGVGPNLLAWDSLASAVPLAELQGVVGKAHVAQAARVAGTAMRKMLKIAATKRCHIMVINQTRQRMGVIFGDATTTPGGKAVKFAASQRLQMWGGKALKNKIGQHVGRTITIMAVKNRFAQPHRKAKIRFMFNSGFESNWSVIDHAKNMGQIPKGLKADQETYARAFASLEANGWGTPGNEDPQEDTDALEVAEDATDGTTDQDTGE